MGNNLAEYGARALYIIFLARYLGVADYGLWSYALALYTFLMSLINFGMESLMPLRVGSGKEGVASYLNETLSMRFALIAIIAILMVLFLLVADVPTASPLVLLWVLPAFIGRSIALWVRVCFTAHEKVIKWLRLSMPLAIAEPLFGIALLISGTELAFILALHAAIWCLHGAIGMWMVRQQLTPIKLTYSIVPITQHLRAGLPLGFSGALMMWLMASPLLLLAHISGDTGLLGIFALPFNIALLLYALLQAFLAAALPVLSRANDRKDPRLRSYGPIILLCAGISMGIAGFIGALYGELAFTTIIGLEFALSGQIIGPCMLLTGILLAPAGFEQSLTLQARVPYIVLANLLAAVVLAVGFLGWVNPQEINSVLYTIAIAWGARASILIIAGVLFAHKSPTHKSEPL